MPNPRGSSFPARLKGLFLGPARSLRDPELFRKLSLVAFFAWVGLGADGLSSSCYGPEEAFLALGGHSFLGIFVATATAFTIFVITASYSQIVESFPTGGGGYLVASKLLSPTLGMMSGCALLIDYLLTITLSVASGTDALFSFLPVRWQPFRLAVAVLGVVGLTVLNLRGVRESVVPLVPIFLLFLSTHLFAILYGFGRQVPALGELGRTISADVGRTTGELGFVGLLLLVLRSYSMGAGTYTGIEAVSNGMPILREPRVRTAKRTLWYMAISLALTAVGLMLGYLLFRVAYVPGRTLNAIFLEKITAGWGLPGTGFVVLTLLSEAVLLVVAAQTGFLDGPRVLANMSLDRWLPSQFSLLSDRLVIKNGILLMGGAATLLMLASRGMVSFLVVLYSINVFITFCLSQAGMVRHWWRERKLEAGWRGKLAINLVGLVLCGFILVSQLALKFREGGWVTVLITGSLVAFVVFIKRFYQRTQKSLARLDRLMEQALDRTRSPDGRSRRSLLSSGCPPRAKTAVLLVSGFNGTGLHTLLSIRRVFGDQFRCYQFIQAGIVDAGRFKGAGALAELKQHLRQDLARYVSFMRSEGFPAGGFSVVGTDAADEICRVARGIFRRNPNSIFFGGQIVFAEETLFSRLLYNHTTFTVQRRLHQEGIPFIIMPVRVTVASPRTVGRREA
jgi:amino acid transporter